ncbi:MAG: hypothetical protein KBA06_04050 [Saprospiraceae bacterium]|nr:hypothetical protein [Saprospiraceae bacterium]
MKSKLDTNVINNTTDIKTLQSNDSVKITQATDSVRIHKKSNLKIFNWVTSNYPSPKKAVIFSLILPGAGQIYNKKYWKLPLVYGAGFGLAYAINFNYKNYHIFKNAYSQRVNDCNCDNYIGIYSDSSLKIIRDAYRKNLELSYIGSFISYLIIATDAFVDAHLKNFNVNDDLSFKVKPGFNYNSFSSAPMPSLSLHYSF